ncbi:hypothetical protein Bbelb_250590 [Branchiostoma belcheri]|nr:hypothetical protein Bbelb_250590 [Branchiostoma belcheri]
MRGPSRTVPGYGSGYAWAIQNSAWARFWLCVDHPEQCLGTVLAMRGPSRTVPGHGSGYAWTIQNSAWARFWLCVGAIQNSAWARFWLCVGHPEQCLGTVLAMRGPSRTVPGHGSGYAWTIQNSAWARFWLCVDHPEQCLGTVLAMRGPSRTVPGHGSGYAWGPSRTVPGYGSGYDISSCGRTTPFQDGECVWRGQNPAGEICLGRRATSVLDAGRREEREWRLGRRAELLKHPNNLSYRYLNRRDQSGNVPQTRFWTVPGHGSGYNIASIVECRLEFGDVGE